MKIVVTTLVDNFVSDPKCQGEHGLSIYIESPSENILFDTGASGLFARNASKLGLELFGAEIIVVSHGHSDHNGGLATALRECPRAKLCLHKNSVFQTYSLTPEGRRKNIGMSDRTLRAIAGAEELGIVEWIDGSNANLSQNIALLGAETVNSKTPNPKYLRAYENGNIDTDDFSHEISLLISGEHCSCLFTACSHLGILEIISAAKKVASRPLAHVFGGIHTFRSPTAEIRYIANELAGMSTEFYLGHCTGMVQFAEIYCRLGKKVHPLGSGAEFSLEI